MIDIQFIPKSRKDVVDIIVNGKIEHDVHYTAEHRARKRSILLSNQDIINDLCLRTFNEIGAFIEGFSYKKWIGNSEMEFEIYVVCKEEFHLRSYLVISPEIEIGKWKKLYSVRELMDAIQVEYTKENFKKLEYRYHNDNASFFEFFYDVDMNARIGKHLNKVLDFIDKILGRAVDTLIHKIDRSSLITYFYFPAAIKAACQQYLLYFSQFLFDLGIEAEAQIKEEGERTFFKITPTNKSEALESIRHALQVYLTTPDDINVDNPHFVNSDIAVSYWRANIMHLKYQLMLAHSAVQMKDAAIESLRLSNYQYKQLVNDGQIDKSLSKEEDLIKGVLSVTKLEGKGFVINLPEILRKLKRRYKK